MIAIVSGTIKGVLYINIEIKNLRKKKQKEIKISSLPLFTFILRFHSQFFLK